MQHKHKNLQYIGFFRWSFLFLCDIFQFSCSDVWSRQCLPLTTQENFKFEFSDTAFDFRVASKDGCVSSVKWAITLQSVLLYKEMELVSHGTYLDSYVFYHLKNLVYWSFLSVYIDLIVCFFVFLYHLKERPKSKLFKMMNVRTEIIKWDFSKGHYFILKSKKNTCEFWRQLQLTCFCCCCFFNKVFLLSFTTVSSIKSFTFSPYLHSLHEKCDRPKIWMKYEYMNEMIKAWVLDQCTVRWDHYPSLNITYD